MDFANFIKMYHLVSKLESPGRDVYKQGSWILNFVTFRVTPSGEDHSDLERSRGKGRSERSEQSKRKYVNLKYMQL